MGPGVSARPSLFALCLNGPMTPTVSATFCPSHAQFVVYDVHAPFDADEAPLWSLPGEARARPVSVRRAQVSVLLLDDLDLEVHLEVSPRRPEPPHGDWEVTAEVGLLVASGVLGVRAVLDDGPEAFLNLPPGRVRLRVVGRAGEKLQVYRVQAWPATG